MLNKNIYLLIILSLNYCANSQNQKTSVCESQETCGACIQQLGCVWCISPQMNTSVHCLPEQNLPATWCSAQNQKNPKSHQEIAENLPFSSDEVKPIQLKPQRFKLTLRKGDKANLTFQYQQAKNYPVDLYYIMDLSASMLTHKDKLGQLGNKLAEAMIKLTDNFRLGFGSFVDKIELPFVNTAPEKLKQPCKLGGIACVSPYSFINHMPLTKNYKQFTNEVNKAPISGNIDSPEGGFDAIMQAIVCHDEIGWRADARRLMVFSTDADFHIAGDGKLAGVVEPNDAQCHMQNHTYTDYLTYDYPSISQINYVAKRNNMNLIFAIVENHKNKITLDTYKDLSKKVENSNFGVLEKSSDNVITLIRDNYNKIVDSVTINSNATDDISVKIAANCKDKKQNGCSKVHVGEEVTFTATFELTKCPEEGSFTKIIALKPEGLSETILVELEAICSCNCPNSQPNATDCTQFGNLECGVCECQSGRFGQHCQCDYSMSQTENSTVCQATRNSDVCSGVGDCICGKCECNERNVADERIYGKFCECNNFSCKDKCSGNGVCDCGECKCSSGFTGEACECPESNLSCMEPNSDISDVCSGNGKCVCGKCECFNGDISRFSGKYCEECTSCPSRRCAEYRHCVECQGFKSGLYSEDDCKQNCTKFETILVDKTEKPDDDIKECRVVNEKTGCSILFTYSYDIDDNLRVEAQETMLCPEPPNIWAWIGGVVGSIVLAGLIALIVWKVITSIHDRKEYAKFESEKQRLKWSAGENPLYKNTTTTFSNPAYMN